MYSDEHPEVDVYGDRDGLLALANATRQSDALELALDEPPTAWQGSTHPLLSIKVTPTTTGDTRISFARVRLTFVICGSSNELARVIGASIASLADGPAKTNGVGSHLHLDPTSDPDKQVYAPDSISAIGLTLFWPAYFGAEPCVGSNTATVSP